MMVQDYKNTFINIILMKSNNQKDVINKLKRIHEIVFNLKKSVLCSTMYKTISFTQSCTLEVYIYDPMG